MRERGRRVNKPSLRHFFLTPYYYLFVVSSVGLGANGNSRLRKLNEDASSNRTHTHTPFDRIGLSKIYCRSVRVPSVGGPPVEADRFSRSAPPFAPQAGETKLLDLKTLIVSGILLIKRAWRASVPTRPQISRP